MKGLLLKDFYSVRTEYRSFVCMFPILVLFVILMNINTADGVSAGNFGYLASYLEVATLSLTLNSFSYDEKCGFLQYALVTPVNRKEYIKSKYVFHLLHSVIGAVVGTVWMIASAGIFNHAVTADDIGSSLTFSGGCLGAVIILGVWQVGLAIKYDAAKARMMFVSLIVDLGILAAFATFGYLKGMFGNAYVLAAVLVAVVLLFTIWMFCMSFVWAERKEF